ncbi:MAG: tetratricopeptide repeat protein [Phycisphaerales bacterium]|nr:tetratricopeptide repeat protein [Phycisphaerae bacterium]NNM24930.1 tetratricopeptide repeat protein [Phycisphaerales bacterium]
MSEPPPTPVDIFSDALELPPEDRDAFIERAAAGNAEIVDAVKKLIAAHDSAARSSFLREPELEGLPATATTSGPLGAGDQVGPYTVIAQLGEGGMGVVYVAQQEHPHRRVALKVVKPGLVTNRMLRRFEYEAEVLGLLHHPGIAHIYEAGTADGGQGSCPYFAMELVDGSPITIFADEQKLGVRERVHLVAKICDAVQHAHQKGVIHRDLKPANIMVEPPHRTAAETDGDTIGEPKILDFGVARAAATNVAMTTIHTNTGQLIGTLQYMSPEQCEGDPTAVDTRSDIYAVGVMCYELLAGKPPHELKGKTLPEALRVIHEQEPRSLGEINPECRGDLATVVAKAMDRERSRRYSSAANFAADLRRYLNDEPVLARRLGPVGRSVRWVRRNRRVAAVAGVALVLIATATIFALDAAGDRREAEWQRQRDLVDRLADMRQTIPVEALDEAVREVETLLADDPVAEYEARTAIGLRYRPDDPEKAEEQFRIARQRAARVFPPESAQIAEAHHNLGAAYYWQRRYQDALREYRHAYELRARLGSEAALAETVNHLAATHMGLGEYTEAERLFREALEIRQRRGDPLDVAKGQNNLAVCLLEIGRYDEEVERLLEDALSAAEAERPRDPTYLARGRHNLGRCLMLQGRYDEAWSRLETACTLKEALGDDASLASTRTVMAELELRRGNLAEAVTLADEAAAMARLRDKADPLLIKGRAFIASGRAAEAEPLLREAREIRRNYDLWQLPAIHPLKAEVDVSLGWCLAEQGRYSEAEPLLLDALETFRTTFDPAHPRTIDTLRSVARLYERWQRPEQAAEYEAVLAGLTDAGS